MQKVTNTFIRVRNSNLVCCQQGHFTLLSPKICVQTLFLLADTVS